MTVAAAYIRESTVAQGDRYGPDAQRAAIARAVADLDLELVAEYSDLISGTGALKRSDFQRMVADARERRFSVLVVYDTSRFARNEADAFTYEAALRAAGARIYYARRVYGPMIAAALSRRASSTSSTRSTRATSPTGSVMATRRSSRASGYQAARSHGATAGRTRARRRSR